MQKKHIIYFTLILALVGCKKPLRNAEEYFPEVKTQRVVPIENGGLRVYGEIMSPGNTKIKYVGFCMDTLPSPAMTSNQIIASTSEDLFFQANYSAGLVTGKTYYFRTWACNEHGYAIGNVVAMSAPSVTPSCTPELNTLAIKINGNSIGSSYILSTSRHDESDGTTRIEVKGGNWDSGNLVMTFGSGLQSKIFTTTDTAPGVNEVLIEGVGRFFSGVVKEGQKVYVNEISAGKFEITLCDLQADNYRLMARFRLSQ